MKNLIEELNTAMQKISVLSPLLQVEVAIYPYEI